MNHDGRQVLLIEAGFYAEVAKALDKGASTVLEEAGFSVKRVSVPGVFEIPAAMSHAIGAAREGDKSALIDGIVTLGCVIRGETDHYEHICREASRAIMDMTVNHNIAHGFGILTCETYEQAWERADTAQKNLGARAAQACLRMMDVSKEIHGVAP